MNVELLHYTPITNCDRAISKCWNKPYDPDNVNYDKIDRIANKFKHESTIEHIVYQFDIDGVSRALLQEQARHRMASYSVKSSRYTLGELKNEHGLSAIFDYDMDGAWGIASKYLIPTGNIDVDNASISALQRLQALLQQNVANDLVKYCMPESYKTSYVMTINARSLKNFLSLRSSKSALWEIRDLANAIYQTIPTEHKFLFSDSMKGDS